MDKFLEMENIQNLTQEGIENLNILITTNKTESVIRKLPTNRSSGPDSFTDEFYQTFKEELISVLLKLFQKRKKIEKEEKLLN